MKMLFTLVALVFATTSAHALKKSCQSTLQEALSCANATYKIATVIQDYGWPSNCKNAVVQDQDDDRSQKIYWWQSTGVALAVSNDNVCKSSFAVLPSPAQKVLSINGRGVMLGASGNIYVVGRNGQFSEVLNSKGASLQATGMKGADGGKSVKFSSDNGGFKYDSDVLDRKLNGKSRKADILGYGY